MNLFLQILAVVLLLQSYLVHSDRVYSIQTVLGSCQNSSLELRCLISDKNVTWFKNGNKLDVSGDRMTVEPTSDKTILTIEHITIDDEGKYSCNDTTDPGNITGKS